MATGTNGIATSAEVYKLIYGKDVFNASSATDCPTKSKLINGYTIAYDGSNYYKIEKGDVSVPSSYSNNQCVKYSDIVVTKVKLISKTYTVVNNSNISYSGSISIKVNGTQVVSMNIGAKGTSNQYTFDTPETYDSIVVTWSIGGNVKVRGYYGASVYVTSGMDITQYGYGMNTFYVENA